MHQALKQEPKRRKLNLPQNSRRGKDGTKTNGRQKETQEISTRVPIAFIKRHRISIQNIWKEGDVKNE